MTFVSYMTEAGGTITAPTIVEIGGGGYYFTPTFSTNHGIFFAIATGFAPTYVSGYLRPEDFAGDQIPTIALAVTSIQNFQQGNWKIFTTGADANKMVVYMPDGETVLMKFALTKTDGTAWTAPTGANTTRTVTS